jgi:hypothetical protein
VKDRAKPNVLFYHNCFFVKSETFIYRQAINPYIHPILLSKRYNHSAEMPTNEFTKFKFKRSLTDGLVYKILKKWFGKERYYGNQSIARMKRLLQGQSFDLIHAQFGLSHWMESSILRTLGQWSGVRWGSRAHPSYGANRRLPR